MRHEQTCVNILCMSNPQESLTTVPQWTLGDRLRKALRDAKNGTVSNAAMAAELNCHANTVSNYINDTTTPNHATLRVWALRTGWPIEWLQHGSLADGPTDPEGGEDQGIPSSECVTGDEALILRFPTARVDENLAA